uniref:F-box/kelch-repeat protein At5g42360 n=1 Tax=Anthurium amnicola TaxID=1678845 RepID=A0A1D1XPT5_9ARAE
MASGSGFRRSTRTSRTELLEKGLGRTAADAADGLRLVSKGEIGEDPVLEQEPADRSLSQRVVRNLTRKLRRNKSDYGDEGAAEGGGGKRVPLRCLGLYGKGGGCKVGACDEIDIIGKRRSTAMELSKPRVEDSGLECCSHGVSDLIRMKILRKVKEAEQSILASATASQFTLPDDLLELCLVRLRLPDLQTARLVCKKWRYLTTTPHFVQMRSEGYHQSPWLFLFGIIRDGFSAGEIHALDITLDQWHRVRAGFLKGRFLFSVASVGSDLYAVGGCSSLTNSGTLAGRSPLKTHRGVVVFSPLTGTWRKASPMRFARSGSILGVFEVSSDSCVFQTRPDRQDRRHLKSRVGKTSDVYDDPHRLSIRRQLRDILNENDDLPDSERTSSKFVRQERSKGSRFVLIAVGGRGSWDEPLDSGEIYDPVVDGWSVIQKMPGDLGVACSGTVCNGIFYIYSEADKLAGYDLEKGTWVMIQTSRPPPRLHEYHPRLVSCNGRLFMLCVSWCERDRQLSSRGKAVRKLWELDLALLTWTEVSRHPDAPMDWHAAFVAVRNRIYGIEMFKIFGQVLDFLTVCDVSVAELNWIRISGKHATQAANASSCMTKLMAVMHL